MITSFVMKNRARKKLLVRGNQSLTHCSKIDQDRWSRLSIIIGSQKHSSSQSRLTKDNGGSMEELRSIESRPEVDQLPHKRQKTAAGFRSQFSTHDCCLLINCESKSITRPVKSRNRWLFLGERNNHKATHWLSSWLQLLVIVSLISLAENTRAGIMQRQAQTIASPESNFNNNPKQHVKSFFVNNDSSYNDDNRSTKSSQQQTTDQFINESTYSNHKNNYNNVNMNTNINLINKTDLNLTQSELDTGASIIVAEQIKLPLYMRIVATIACLVIFIVGVTGNLLVPLVVIKTKYLRNSTNLFLINLSMADLLVLLVCMPIVFIELHSRPETWLLGESMCKISNFVETLAANGSIFTILAISFERYYAICKPLKAGYKCTRLRATIIICIIWFFATILTSPILMMAKSNETTYIDGSIVYNCILETDAFWPKLYVFSSMFGFFCLPLIVLMLVYWLIGRRLIRENLAMTGMSSQSTTTIPASSKHQAKFVSASFSKRRSSSQNGLFEKNFLYTNLRSNSKRVANWPKSWRLTGLKISRKPLSFEHQSHYDHHPMNHDVSRCFKEANCLLCSHSTKQDHSKQKLNTKQIHQVQQADCGGASGGASMLFRHGQNGTHKEDEIGEFKGNENGHSERTSFWYSRINDLRKRKRNKLKTKLVSINANDKKLSVQTRAADSIEEKRSRLLRVFEDTNVTSADRIGGNKQVICSSTHYAAVNGNYQGHGPNHHRNNDDDISYGHCINKQQCELTHRPNSSLRWALESLRSIGHYISGSMYSKADVTESSTKQAVVISSKCHSRTQEIDKQYFNNDPKTCDSNTGRNDVRAMISLRDNTNQGQPALNSTEISPDHCSALKHSNTSSIVDGVNVAVDSNSSPDQHLRSESIMSLTQDAHDRESEIGAMKRDPNINSINESAVAGECSSVRGNNKDVINQMGNLKSMFDQNTDDLRESLIKTNEDTSRTDKFHADRLMDQYYKSRANGGTVDISKFSQISAKENRRMVDSKGDCAHDNDNNNNQDLGNTTQSGIEQGNPKTRSNGTKDQKGTSDWMSHASKKWGKRFGQTNRRQWSISSSGGSSSGVSTLTNCTQFLIEQGPSNKASRHHANCAAKNMVIIQGETTTSTTNSCSTGNCSPCLISSSPSPELGDCKVELNDVIDENCAIISMARVLDQKSDDQQFARAGNSFIQEFDITGNGSIQPKNSMVLGEIASNEYNDVDLESFSVVDERANEKKPTFEPDLVRFSEENDKLASAGSNGTRKFNKSASFLVSTKPPRSRLIAMHHQSGSLSLTNPPTRGMKKISSINNKNHQLPVQAAPPSEYLVVKDLSAKKQQMDSRRQVVVMLAFVVTCFFLLFLPYRMFTIWLILSTETQVQSLGMETYYNLTYFSRILIYLHSAINPIAYNLISTKFRSAFMSILFCRGSSTRRQFTTDFNHQSYNSRRTLTTTNGLTFRNESSTNSSSGTSVGKGAGTSANGRHTTNSKSINDHNHNYNQHCSQEVPGRA